MLLVRVLPLVIAAALSVVSDARGQSDPGGGLKAEIIGCYAARAA